MIDESVIVRISSDYSITPHFLSNAPVVMVTIKAKHSAATCKPPSINRVNNGHLSDHFYQFYTIVWTWLNFYYRR